jgi:hypothetical protein
MAEVQTHTNSGEMIQRFVEFVMMHAQQASLFLGRIPHPQTGKSEVRLDAAKLFIDQLEMIQSKTKGNLTKEEEEILASILGDLRMTYVQVSTTASAEAATPGATEPEAPKAEAPVADESGSEEDKKKFSKSYGA